MPPAQTAANANASGISPRDLIGQTVVHIMQILQLLTAMVNGLSPDVTTPRTLRLSIAGATEHFAALTRQLDEHDARAIAVRLEKHDRRRRMRGVRVPDGGRSRVLGYGYRLPSVRPAD